MNKILIAFFITVLVYGVVLGLGLASNQALLLASLALLIALWTNEGLPLGVVSLFPLLLFPLLGLSKIGDVAQNYSKPIIFLFLGGFLLALAFEKTRLHIVVANKILAIFPKTARGRIYAVMTTSALLSSILSNTTITLMLIPIVLSLAPLEKGYTLTSRFLLATAYGASIGGVLTPIGTPPNLILLGFLDANQLPSFSFLSWVFMLLPVVVVMLTIVPYVLSIGLDSMKSDPSSLLSKDESHYQVPDRLTPPQRKLTVILILLVVLLLANSSYGDFYHGLGISETIILLGAGLLLFLPGIGLLKWEDTTRIPWEIIFLFGAGFSIASTMIQSGLPEMIVEYTKGMEVHLLLLVMIIALVVSMSTEVTSNTAFIAVALPIFYQFSIVNGLDPRFILPIATVATSYAFMLPIATPPNAIIMSNHIVKVKTMIRNGFAVNMIGVVVLSLIAYFLWQ